jgi:hypothetical protein
MTCPDSGTSYYVARDTSSRASQASAGQSVIDGTNGAKISCSVRPSGAGYTFSGSFTGTTLYAPNYPITVTFSNGMIGDDKVKGTAAISVLTPKLGGTFNSDMPCPITILEGAIKPGSMWAEFTCPTVSLPLTGVCTVDTDSVVVFENCDGS